MTIHSDENPLLSISHPIPFDRIRAEHIAPAVATLLGEAKTALAEVEAPKRSRTYVNTMAALEEVAERLGSAMRVVGHLESVATTPELRAAYSAAQPEVSAFFSSINSSDGAYRAVKAFADTDEAKALSPTRARFVAKTLDDFKREGAALSPADKLKLSAINVELSKNATKFSQNVLDATVDFELVVEDESSLAGLPERAIEAARASAKSKGKQGFRFSLQAPSLMPVLTHLKDRAIRETMYRAFNTRASTGAYDNSGVTKRILELRQEKAELLGYDNFVDLVLEDRMAGSGSAALQFVQGLCDKSRVGFARENEALEEFYRREEGAGAPALSPWDVAYYAERQRKSFFNFDEEQVRSYFELDSVLEGMFELVAKLYGIRVQTVGGMPTWHEDVRTYQVCEESGAQLGVFYADFFPREAKRDGAWMNAFMTGLPEGSRWSPHVGLICANVTPPIGDQPALLSHREVETVFHEFGHLLHHMLSRVEVRSLAGTNVAWDFVELPSQIMENFCWERASLDLFARHHQTRKPLPDELFLRMSEARTYRGANMMMRQLGFANLDLSLHINCPALNNGDVVAYASEVMQPFSAVEQMTGYAMVLGFGHLFSDSVGYAGGYYSYKWAEVLDADAFSRFRENGLFSREIGQAFRDAVLSRGDSRDPMELYIDFMGRKPDQQALLTRSGISGN